MQLTSGYLVFLLTLACFEYGAAATVTCDNCADCSTKLQTAAAGDTVELATDIESSGTSCVNFGSSHNVIFDGGGHVVARGTAGYYGVHLPNSATTGNTIRDVEVRGFSQGIYIVYGSGNTISDCRVIDNGTGIDFYSASSNIVENCLVNQNFAGILVRYNSDNNIVRNSYITRNHDTGIAFSPHPSVGDPENTQVYNNVLSNAAESNVRITTIWDDEDRDLSGIAFIFNSPLTCDQGANIMGCGCKGGNYWEQPLDQGFSQTCGDADNNGVCDGAYTLAHATTAVMVDAYPLSVPPTGCCVNADRDGDGFSRDICGGDDHDDDPLSCGAACHPGASEVCDGYDNDDDGRADGTLACQDMLLPKKALLPRVTAAQSCVEDPATHQIFCFGGGSFGSAWYLDTITSYDPAADTLTELTTKLPSPREGLSCSYAPSTGKMCCFGGYSQETICTKWEPWGCVEAYVITHPINEIVEFNPADGSVHTLAATLPVAMEGTSSAWSNQSSTIFVFGGTFSPHSGDQDFILEFNPVAGTLTEREARLPSVRYNHSCAANSATGKIYCFGGFSPGPAYGLAEIVEFDPATDDVRLMNAAFPTKMYDTSCVEDSVDHLIYCLGGRGLPTSPNYTDRIYVFDPVTDSLTQKSAKFLSERCDHSCAENSATNKIYCFGGTRNVIDISEIIEYTPSLPALGDVNVSGEVDLTDLVQSLQVTAGAVQSGISRKADVDGDRKLGLGEAIYIFRNNAEL